MNTDARQSTCRNIKYASYTYFFVSKNDPFIGDLKTKFIPFVSINKPVSKFMGISRQSNGFTLIELVVTIAVAAILVTVAVPNMRTFIQNGRITTQVNDLITDLNYARSEAIKRRTNVAICQSSNGTACTGGNWKDGRLTYADLNKNGVLDGNDVVLRFRGAPGGGDSTLTTTATDPLEFTSNGATTLTATKTFTFCDDRGATKGKTVQLNATGQATVNSTPPAGCY
jgi:type IV fimbrial biogenesis protein FimT